VSQKMSFPNHEQFLQLAIFRLEDVCVRVQEGMESFMRTAALEKAAEIEATFRWLRRRGVMVCLLSDYDRDTTSVLLGRLNWQVEEDMLVQIVITEQQKQANPIQRAMDLAGIPSPRCVILVADTPRLLRLGHKAGVFFNLGVTSGSRSYQALSGEPHRDLLDHPVQLPNYLLTSLPDLEMIRPGDATGVPRLMLPRPFMGQ
jgi:phosphoglycolate phosphatase-like HAD superfamily hydrolase